MFVSNISLWGPQTERYMNTVEHHIAIVAEHRQGDDELTKMRLQLRRGKWEATIAPAIATDAGSTSAGVMVAWKNNLMMKEAAVDQCEGRLVAATLGLKGGSSCTWERLTFTPVRGGGAPPTWF